MTENNPKELSKKESTLKTVSSEVRRTDFKPKQYNPLTDEKQWQEFWEKNKIYTFNPKSKAQIYSIDTPPPTVSGKMHLGHAFSYSQQDFVARYHRMKGESVFYPFGTDDNGLATERMIEKMKNVKSKKMQRSDFIKLCDETLKDVRPAFVQGWKDVAISCDFSLFYSTINDHCRTISQRSFIDLHKQGRVYQKKAPVIFCPQCKTAIAQVEMEDVEKQTTLNYIKAKTETGEYIIYATTRPELHPGCVGISLNKDGDYVTVERNNNEKWIISKDAVEKMQAEFPMKVLKTYKGEILVGKKVTIPFAEEQKVITHDISAKTEYGTGIVYYCTYGGLDCVEWMARHTDVKAIEIMDESGTYTKGPYAGMNSEEARKKVLEDLEKQGSLIKKQGMKHAVNTHERCGTDIEYIATKQWFIRYLDLKEEFLAAGREIQWYPEHMRVRYENWIKGLQWDWCISRQRYFGVPFPVWHCNKCHEINVPQEKDLPIDPLLDKPKKACACGNKEFTPEQDVLDTWATSSMTPFLAIELFKKRKDYKELEKKLFPMNLRPQAHDIITFWLFNTVVKSRLHKQQNPWKQVMIAGHALDPHGKKMSKSKGNVIEPQDMIKKYGADALRFWAAASKLGDDLPFMEKDLVTGQKMITKLWNASSFCLMHLKDFNVKKFDKKRLKLMDRWMLSKLNRMIIEATDAFEIYEYAKTRFCAEQFFWKDFCDYYLEVVKDRIYNPDRRGKETREAAQYGLYTGILTVLKLMAPIMPHITEAVYQEHFVKKEKIKSIHVSSWPKADMAAINEEDEKTGDVIVAIISAVRKAKSEKSVSLKEPIKVLTIECVAEKQKQLEEAFDDLAATTNSAKIVFGKGEREITVELKISVDF